MCVACSTIWPPDRSCRHHHCGGGVWSSQCPAHQAARVVSEQAASLLDRVEITPVVADGGDKTAPLDLASDGFRRA